ncbi:MAG: hypothetical protein AAFX78_07100 [Cyanobacteria bacterium J06638_20]
MYLQLGIKFKLFVSAAIYSAPFFIANAALANPLSSTEESFPIISCPLAPHVIPISGEPSILPTLMPTGNSIPPEESLDFLAYASRELVEANQLDAALHLVNGITDIEEQRQQYFTVLMTLIDMEAYEQLEEVITQTETQNITLQLQQLQRLISRLVAAGKYDLIMELAQTSNDPALRQQIASHLAEAGEFERAQDVIQTIDSSAFQAIALMDSAKALANAGRREEAQVAFESARQQVASLENMQAASLENTREYLSVLVYIAEILATLGWVDEALEIFAQMPTLTMETLLSAPDLRGFNNRYERLKVEILLTISNHLFEAGDIEQATQINQLAIDKSFELNLRDIQALADEIATQLITYQQFDRLFEWNRVANENRIWLGLSVAPLLAQNNQIDLALEFIENDPYRDDLLGLIVANSYRQNPDRAYEIALTIQDEENRASRLYNMANYLIDEGAYERVVAIAQHMSTTQTQFGDFRLELLARELSRVGEYEHAAQVVGLIANSQQREAACQNIRVQASENLVNTHQVE